MSRYIIKLKIIGKKRLKLQSWLLGYLEVQTKNKRTIRYVNDINEFLVSINDSEPDIIINTNPTLNAKYNQHTQLCIIVDDNICLTDVPSLLTHLFNIFPDFYHKRRIRILSYDNS